MSELCPDALVTMGSLAGPADPESPLSFSRTLRAPPSPLCLLRQVSAQPHVLFSLWVLLLLLHPANAYLCLELSGWVRSLAAGSPF